MHTPLIAAAPTALALSTALLGCSAMCPTPAAPSAAPPAAVASADAGKAHPSKPPEARRVYRLDVVLSAGDTGKTPSESAFTLSLEEDRGGDIRVGNNIQLTSQARQDVGLNLHFSYVMAGEDLLLHSGIEMSSFDEPSTVHKLMGNGDAVVAPGKPALVASVEDPMGHKRYQLTVTATKLR
jgi:hypothetical protein